MSDDRIYTILVAEDEMFQRLALLDFMDFCNYEATAVENGKLALDELRKPDSCFDLVLLDLAMPEMDGFELLTIMMQDERLKDIPVIIMSANESTNIVSHCLRKLFHSIHLIYDLYRDGSYRLFG
jgi:CheY-like chemotaxis protein